jgi:tetratricopeptide (TPR) repeat protein
MILDLDSRRLINIKRQGNQDIYSVHRLLQRRLLQDLDKDPREREEIFCMAFELIRERLPRPSVDTPDSLKWNVFKEYLPHVLSLQRVYYEGQGVIAPFVRLAELFRDGGVHLWQRGLIYDGLRLLNSAEAILDKLQCDEYQLRADIHIATALLIQYFGISHRAESRDRFSKILQIRKTLADNAAPETYTKEDEIPLYNAMADYGNALLQFNQYQEAEPIYQECHHKYWEWGTEDDIPLEYAKFNHHMAFCRMFHRDFENAIKLSEKAVELVSRQSGQVQLILRFKFDLATIILQSGDAEKSLQMQEQIVKARLNLQGNGKANYFTLQSYYAVGALCASLGRLDEAEYVTLSIHPLTTTDLSQRLVSHGN